MKRLIIPVTVILCIAILCSCTPTIQNNGDVASESAGLSATYRQIGVAEAVELMHTEEDYIILDVRTQEEFDAGHIPNAICIPNENIGASVIPDLPDKGQLILVYCRSGRRSKEAAQKLADAGYTNIVEFGGIIDWTGETVTEENKK